MAIVNAKQFALKTGYPLSMIRAFCREGLLSHWKRGRVYLLNEDEALSEMQTMKTTNIHQKRLISKPVVRRRAVSGQFDYRDTIKQMQAESKKRNEF